MKIKSVLFASAFALLAAPALAAPAIPFDTDKDGTLDLAEAKVAASAAFDRLEKDKDGTLDIKEMRGRMTKRAWTAADPDKDGTLTQDEFFSAVEAAFKRADKDGEGTLDARELRGPAGRELMKLLR